MRITPLEIQNEAQACRLMTSLGVSKEGIDILAPKSVSVALKIDNINSWEANIIKQHLLSLGADAALNRNVLIKNTKTSILIFGSLSQMKELSEKLKSQPFQLNQISEGIRSLINNYFKDDFTFKARDKVLKIKKPVICGIVNLTPDSFSGDGLLNTAEPIASALEKVAGMIKYGAKIIDLGGESSRPFSQPVKEKEETARVIPFLKAVRKNFPKLIISVDTYKYAVARAAVNEGADVINDITALRHSPEIAALIKKYHLGCVIMHMKKTPLTMQKNPGYDNVTEEIIDFLKERLRFLQEHGIKEEQIAIDPGVGFGKRLQDNLRIIKELYKFKIFGLPVFLGVSRKTFIGDVLKKDVQERVIGSVASGIISFYNGASILRVHDVKETAEAIKLVSAIAVS